MGVNKLKNVMCKLKTTFAAALFVIQTVLKNGKKKVMIASLENEVSGL